jgi:hypothetical protein
MITPDLQSELFIQDTLEANFDPPHDSEKEEWELVLSRMKAAILEKKFLKARHLMYSLEFKIIDSNIKSYNEGFQHGSVPLPF